MTVKTIFKTLIGTVVVIVVGFLLIEMFNLSIQQFMLRQVQDLGAVQQAQLFCQETYKQQTEKDSTNAKSTVFPQLHLKKNQGGQDFVISGKFYPNDASDTVESYYNALYAGNANYQGFLAGANCNVAPSGVYPALISAAYDGNYVTPANFGIPYLDPEFMQKAFTWNLAMLFGSPDKNTQTIQGSGVATSQYTVTNAGTAGGKSYIDYSGYRIYVGNNTQTKITGISYHIYNILDGGEAEAFKTATNIDPNNLTTLHAGADGYSDEMQLITQTGGMQIYLQNLTVVKIDYTVEVGYEGITPLQNMISYIQSNRVRGMEDSAPQAPGGGFDEDATDTLEGTVYYWMVA